ncbi:MAG TPA: alpha-amylase family glycosyl hydrolase, partial [Gemmataceae bacterium]
MVTDLFAPEVLSAVEDFLAAAGRGDTKQVAADGRTVAVPYPFPSPADWRDCWIYFLMVDRFNNPSAPPRGAWNRKYDFHQGGTFNGIREQLGYIRDLGAGAVWLTPVLKNARPDTWRWNYHGYGIQDFLNVDERFGSDGTRATAERELVALVEEAHARGLYVILDIVLNHAGRVFDYVWQGEVRADIPDNRGLLYGPLGNEPPVQWLNGHGSPRDDWQAPPGWPSGLPPPQQLSPDDAVWPADLQRADFFRRRGAKVTDDPPPDGHIPGDFGVLRQLVADYLVTDRGNPLRQKYGPTPVLDILIRTHQY